MTTFAYSCSISRLVPYLTSYGIDPHRGRPPSLKGWGWDAVPHTTGVGIRRGWSVGWSGLHLLVLSLL